MKEAKALPSDLKFVPDRSARIQSREFLNKPSDLSSGGPPGSAWPSFPRAMTSVWRHGGTN